MEKSLSILWVDASCAPVAELGGVSGAPGGAPGAGTALIVSVSCRAGVCVCQMMVTYGQMMVK